MINLETNSRMPWPKRTFHWEFWISIPKWFLHICVQLINSLSTSHSQIKLCILRSMLSWKTIIKFIIEIKTESQLNLPSWEHFTEIHSTTKSSIFRFRLWGRAKWNAQTIINKNFIRQKPKSCAFQLEEGIKSEDSNNNMPKWNGMKEENRRMKKKVQMVMFVMGMVSKNLNDVEKVLWNYNSRNHSLCTHIHQFK